MNALIVFYRVAHCPFNLLTCPELIGNYFIHCPAFCVCERIEMEID